MVGLDGLASAAIANAEARAAAYDAWISSGKKLDEAAMKQIQDDVYNRTWDANGKLVDEKVAYQTSEIALNLDSDNVRAFNNLLNKNPWLKTHLLFPRSLASAMTGFGERSPITLFMNDYRKLVMGGGYEKFSQEEIAAIMTPRGLPPTKVEFDKLRAEMRGRVALGTVAIYKAVDLWMQGRLRGDGNSDAARQRTRNQMGWKAGTVQTNDGDWVDISWLGPHGQWMKLIATYMDNFFDDIDPVNGENFFGKMMFVFASGFTNQSMYASVEPLMDTLEGNGVAMARWAANYTSNLAPLSKIRQQIGDTMYPGLRIMENDFQSYFLNRNKFLPGGKEMPHMHDWLEGQKVGYPENPFVRFWNANFPMKIYDGDISPQRQYLMDVGWDSRPIFEKGENGVEYTVDEQAALYEQFGKDRFFFDDVTDIMNRVPSQAYLQSMKEQRANGMQVDAALWYDVHRDLNAAARKAKKLALAGLDPSMLTEIRLREAAEADRQRRQRQGVADPKEGYNAVTMTNN